MIVKPVISAAEAAAKVKAGDVVQLGGFLGCGSPDSIIEALVAAGAKDLTLVCNDTGIHNEAKSYNFV